MLFRNTFYTLFLLISLTACGPSQNEFDELKAKNEQLKADLNECQFGANKITAKIEKAYNEGNLTLAKQNIELLYSKHPESPRNKEFKVLLKTIIEKEHKLQLQKEAEEKERQRIANLNNTGMWVNRYYVDEFHEPTDEMYIKNAELIKGVFSNTATQNSDLNVKFLIDRYCDINIQLFEYARNNPVKAHYKQYIISVQDKDGKRYSLEGSIYESDRLNIKDCKILNDILVKGGGNKVLYI